MPVERRMIARRIRFANPQADPFREADPANPSGARLTGRPISIEAFARIPESDALAWGRIGFSLYTDGAGTSLECAAGQSAMPCVLRVEIKS